MDGSELWFSHLKMGLAMRHGVLWTCLWHGLEKNLGVLQRCKDSELSAPVGTSATESAIARNSVPFYINLILGCRGGKGHLQCCLKTDLQTVGSGDDRVSQPNGYPVQAAL